MFVKNGQVLDPTESFTINEITYPGKWLLEATHDQLRHLGITVSPDPPVCDTRFYWGVDGGNYCIPKKRSQLVKEWTQATHNTANSKLADTDWVVIQSLDENASVDPAIKAWRQAVREAVAEKCTKLQETEDTYGLQIYVTGSDYNTWPEKPA